MNKNSIKPIILATLMALSLTGCDSIPFMNNTPDYKGAGRSRPLEVPPDLTASASNDTYTVPGSMTYSEFNQAQENPGEKEKILSSPDNVKMERAGSQRWLVVQAPAEKIWPVIREFWNELGFAVRVENPDTGVMETEWVDPSTITQNDDGSYLEKFQGWLDRLNMLNTRQKFRTRLDRGEQPNTTEIFMSHRAVADNLDDGKERTRTTLGVIEGGYKNKKAVSLADEKAAAAAEELDAELLRRLMVRLGIEEKKSRSIIADSTPITRAKLNKASDGTASLSVSDEFDRAWRRVGLALDRIGFVVEDKNRSSGLYFVRYTDIEVATNQQKKKGVLDSLKFWGDDKETEAQTEAKEDSKKDDTSITDKLKFWKAPEKKEVDNSKQYLIKVEPDSDKGTKVSVVDKAGNINQSSTANVILNMLYEQLK